MEAEHVAWTRLEMWDAVPAWFRVTGEGVVVVAVTAIAAAALHAVIAGRTLLLWRSEPLLLMSTAGLAALVAVLYGLIARIRSQDYRLPIVATAWTFYGLGVMPLTAMRTATGADVVVETGRVTAAVVFLVMLGLPLLGMRSPWVVGVRGLAMAVLFTATTMAVSAWLPGSASQLLLSQGPDVVVRLGWLALGCGFTVRGLRTHDPVWWRLGLGLGIIAVAHLASLFLSGGVLQLVVLRALGLLALTAGIARCARVLGRQLQAQRMAEAERAAAREHAYAQRDHEMRNALANLSAVPTLIGAGTAAPISRSQMVDLFSSELARLRDLLDERSGHDTSARVDLILTRLATLRRATGMSITLSCPDGLVAAAPAATVAQVVTNLLANCARHAPGSPVHLRAERRDDACVIEVTDAGPGLAAGDGGGDPGSNPGSNAGSGLGLALTTQLLAEHGGTLQLAAATSEGTGATARIVLPMARSRHLSAVPDAAGSAGSTAS